MYVYRDRNGTHKHIKRGNRFVRENIPTRKTGILYNYEIFYNDSEIVIEKHPSTIGRFFLLLTFPLCLLIYGIGNYREIYQDHYATFFSKKSGSFSADVLYRDIEKMLDKLKQL